ncbi:hypothetical protein CCACVL1_04566 [Corchorus capsularis]|uniref:AT-hook motif nuclear-localized protein n=1 Tax=Corchorus capsularis TaxID=210143 RepID=A0A1R3JRC8_COCAP|nr:hypothetical protein CCACVL1_04566 [Corchorus capsularis]
MESREAVTTTTTATGGVTVVGSDAPSDYHIAPRSENSIQNPNSTPGSAPPPQPPPQTAGQPVPPPVSVSGLPGKKKRGRPRKYGPDGSVTMALSPKPISTAAPPPVIDFSAGKKPKVKSPTSVSKAKYELENLGEKANCHFDGYPFEFQFVLPLALVVGYVDRVPSHLSEQRTQLQGEWVACSVGANFTPHIITVNAGEDVTMKIISFSQQGPRAICILSANGVISSVTLRQPDSSGGTLTYEFIPFEKFSSV